MRLNLISNSSLTKTNNLISYVSIMAVVGPVLSVSGGLWDAISHLQREPEFFWTIQHISVYAGVSIISAAAILGAVIISRKHARGILGTGIKLVLVGAIIQIVSGFGDSISHDVFGIDGLISWSHQPLELGLVLASLGGFLILKTREDTRLKLLLPFSIVSFMLFSAWLGFNLVLIFGHTIQCLPVYEIFSSGCAIL